MIPKPLPEPQATWSQILPHGLFTWLVQLHKRVNEDIQIRWTQVNSADGSLSDFGEKSHQLLDDILPADDSSTDTAQNRHVSDAQANGWEDHKDATADVHGASGSLIGADDAASTGERGVVYQAGSVADLNQTLSGTYTQSEVQAISDKVDELLVALRAAGLLET